MGWQRYNRSTNVFEVSDDNGASWQVLHIAGGGLNPNVAYRNIDNNFVPQTLGSTSVIAGANSLLSFVDNGAPSGEQTYRFVNYRNGQGLRFESLTDGSASVKAAWIFLPNGAFDSEIITTRNQQATNSTIAAILDSQGATYARGTLRQGLDPPNGTGLACWFVESSNHIRAAGGLYDNARSVPIGSSTDFTPSFSGGATLGTNYASYYTLIGNTCFVTVYAGVTISGAGVAFYMTLPGGLTSNRYAAIPIYKSTENAAIGWVQAQPGLNYIGLYNTLTAGNNWLTGPVIIGFQLQFTF